MEIHFRRLLFQVGERERKMNNKNLTVVPRPKKVTRESKELNSKNKKKNASPQPKERRKEERQISKDKQQVKREKNVQHKAPERRRKN